MSKTYVKMIAGRYEGRKGYVEIPSKALGTAMFYSKEGEFPYRACVYDTDYELITEAEYLAD